MTRSVLLRPRAAQDLDEIWEYTNTRWGLEQAERYLRALWADIQVVADNPGLGPICTDLRNDFRRRVSGAHTVLYRVTDPGVEVVRILHGRMDGRRHLG